MARRLVSNRSGSSFVTKMLQNRFYHKILLTELEMDGKKSYFAAAAALSFRISFLIASTAVTTAASVS